MEEAKDSKLVSQLFTQGRYRDTPVSVLRWKATPVDPGEFFITGVSPAWAPVTFLFDLDPGENPVREGPPGSTPVNFLYIVNPGENFIDRNHPGIF